MKGKRMEGGAVMRCGASGGLPDQPSPYHHVTLSFIFSPRSHPPPMPQSNQGNFDPLAFSLPPNLSLRFYVKWAKSVGGNLHKGESDYVGLWPKFIIADLQSGCMGNAWVTVLIVGLATFGDHPSNFQYEAESQNNRILMPFCCLWVLERYETRVSFCIGGSFQCGLIGRTRSTKAQTQNETINCNGVAWNESNKKLKTLNDELEGNDSSDRIRETKNRWDGVIQYSRNKRLKRLEESKNDERRTIAEEPKDDESTTDEEQKTDENDPVVVEKPTGGYLVGPICEEEPKSQSQKASIKDESNDGSLKLQTAELIDESKEIDIAMEEKLPKRFTRSALKSKEDTVESLESDYNFCNSVAIGVDEKTNGAVRSLTSPKKLGLKMSKKIALNKVPLTIRDLLETGMLEGYPVTYDGRKKGYRLQGTIKGNGILCSCSLCKGSRVVLPSQFELHACKSYRHAAKYIYLDNGKNLHDVLHVCKDAPLETLEATIQSAIGSFPVKRSLPADEAAKMDPLGNSCIKRNNSPATSIHRTSERARLLKPIPVTKSSGSALYNSSENKSLGKITKKDQRLHRLVFEEGGLPDGTEVAYYAGGKKLLDGYKKGFGIFCWCCHCEVSASQFEAHAGWASRKKPYSYIYTSNGVSLHELAISLSKGRKYSARDNDDLCSICGDGGNLLLCDGCPRAFHRVRVGLWTFANLGVPKIVLSKACLDARCSGGREGTSCCIRKVAMYTPVWPLPWAQAKPDLKSKGGAGGWQAAMPPSHPHFNPPLSVVCASLPSIPQDDWYCRYCQNMFQREKFVEHNANAVAAGRVSGVDPIEQITKRCIRIVNPEAEVSACVLCRGYDFSKSGFGPRTIILCDQCEKEFHIGCLRDHKMQDLKELPSGKWFCCLECIRIHSALQKLHVRGEEKLPDSLLNVIKEKHERKGLESIADYNVRWRLLSGKLASPETRVLLSEAVAIFHDRFDPIIDSVTGRDLIPAMVYGRNVRGQDFSGLYCAVITVNSHVVSAGILRVFGQEVAELPLVATSVDNQGRGYFQILFSCIEKLLAFLNVRSFVLPAAEEAECIWTKKFGFKKITPDQLSEYRKSFYQMISFQGTCMLEKGVPEWRRIIHQK
ncbi:Increased DNA methylation 1 [Vitis vinifera]|uniref:Increased DNA methylation 1 n=1 Tax=Vitis vinifera TaxID=29760 RepID=A0A438EJT5_VITVI|nr:Increased DNA methylation 1 [Vitis vinifera]